MATARAWGAAEQQEFDRTLATTLREWLLRHQREIVFRDSRWMGVKALKNPMDAWIYQEILHEVRPEVVVEIGSHAGGSTLYLAHLLDVLGDGIVASIDIDRSAFVVQHPRIRLATGDSASPEVFGQVAALAAGRRTLVIHDGDHESEAVLRDLRLYSRLVTPGSYLIVEDSIVDTLLNQEGVGLPTPGPMPAIGRFLAEAPEFFVDKSRERYLLTYNPHGFLKRAA